MSGWRKLGVSGIGVGGEFPLIEFGLVAPFAGGNVPLTLTTEIRQLIVLHSVDWIIAATVGNLPVGQDAIFDVQYSTNNGSTWNSIFSLSSKLTVPAAGPAFGSVTSFAVASLSIGTWVRVLGVQAGTTTAGNGLQAKIY